MNSSNGLMAPIADDTKIRSRKKALDIGCSNGFFLEVLKDNGYDEVCGVEPGEEPKAIARADICDNIHTGFLRPRPVSSRSFRSHYLLSNTRSPERPAEYAAEHIC